MNVISKPPEWVWRREYCACPTGTARREQDEAGDPDDPEAWAGPIAENH